MPESPEARARKNIDQLLTAAGWVVQSREDVNLNAGRGVAIREFPMKPGFGEADYLLYVDAQAVGVVEAKKEGSTLSGFEIQTAKYSEKGSGVIQVSITITRSFLLFTGLELKTARSVKIRPMGSVANQKTIREFGS